MVVDIEKVRLLLDHAEVMVLTGVVVLSSFVF
jgi:hypothetical protein